MKPAVAFSMSSVWTHRNSAQYGQWNTRTAINPSGSAISHIKPASMKDAKTVSPPDRHTPTIMHILNAQNG